MKENVIKKAILLILTEWLSNTDKVENINKYYIIDSALNFTNKFYKQEVGNITEYFDLMFEKISVHKELDAFVKISKPHKTPELHKKLEKAKLDEYMEWINFTILSFYNKEDDLDMDFPVKKQILQSTLDLFIQDADFIADGMIRNIGYEKTKIFSIQKRYREIIFNIENRMKEANNIKIFLKEIEDSNMNYILRLNNIMIYPFLYDLLLHLFVSDTRVEGWADKYFDKKNIFNKLSDVRLNANKDQSDYRFIDVEFLKMAEFLTFIESRESDSDRKDETKKDVLNKIASYVHTYILFSYSRTLECEYNKIQSVMKQMLFEITVHKRSKYNLSKKMINIFPEIIDNEKIRFSKKDFRYYSLMVL